MNKYIAVSLNIILMLYIISTEYSIGMDKSNHDGKFKIIFWDSDISDIKVLQKSNYHQLISKFIPIEILTDEYIIKYYWEEQLIEYEYDRIKKDTGEYFIQCGEGLFSIVFDNKFIYHGISRVGLIQSRELKYDYSKYPAIVEIKTNTPKTSVLALKPRFYPYWNLLSSYDEKVQKGVIKNQEILDYFEKQGKIVLGKVDLKKCLGYEDHSLPEKYYK